MGKQKTHLKDTDTYLKEESDFIEFQPSSVFPT